MDSVRNPGTRFANATVPKADNPQSWILQLCEDEVGNSEDDHEFFSQLANLSLKKTDDACIDSGATHHFFHSRYTFTTYEIISLRK